MTEIIRFKSVIPNAQEIAAAVDAIFTHPDVLYVNEAPRAGIEICFIDDVGGQRTSRIRSVPGLDIDRILSKKPSHFMVVRGSTDQDHHVIDTRKVYSWVASNMPDRVIVRFKDLPNSPQPFDIVVSEFVRQMGEQGFDLPGEKEARRPTSVGIPPQQQQARHG